MAELDPDRDPEAHDERELERLVRFLTRPGVDFGLALARFADPRVATEMRARATALVGAQGGRVTSLDLAGMDEDADIIEHAHALLADADVVFIHGIDQHLVDTLGHPRRPAWLVSLNLRRDRLPELLRGRLVLWVGTRAYPQLAKLAWDLLEVALTRVEFVAERPAVVPTVVSPSFEGPPEWLEFGSAEQPAEQRRQGQAWLARADSSSDPRVVADATAAAAALFVSAGDIDVALEQLERAMRAYGRIPDLEAATRQRLRLAELLTFRGSYELATRQAELADQDAKALGHWRLEARARSCQADALRLDGQWQLAIRLLEELASDSETRGDSFNLALALARSGKLLAAHGQLERGQAALERASELFSALGDDFNWATARTELADLLAERGQLGPARHIYLDEVTPILERLGDARGLAVIRGRIARLHVAEGNLNLALKIMRDEELATYERIGDVRSVAGTKLTMADVLSQLDDHGQARALLEEVIESGRERGDPRVELLGLVELGGLHEQRGELARALIHFEAAADVAGRLGHPLGPDLEAALARLRGSAGTGPHSG